MKNHGGVLLATLVMSSAGIALEETEPGAGSGQPVSSNMLGIKEPALKTEEGRALRAHYSTEIVNWLGDTSVDELVAWREKSRKDQPNND